MALTGYAPIVREADGLVSKLHPGIRPNGAGQLATGAGVSFDPSVCRMLRVSVRMASGMPVGGLSGAELGSPPHRLGNAVDTAEYKVDVCESATGLMLFDEHYPCVRRMSVQGGRDAVYGQDIDYMHIRHGFTVQPIAAGERIQLILNSMVWADPHKTARTDS